MKYTTNQYRIDSEAKHIEIFQDTKFVDLYRKLVHLWGRYTGFSMYPFPDPITKMFPVTEENILPKDKGILW
jgi:hypothetical protein